MDSMGHYFEEVLGTRDIIFVRVSMLAINKAFKLSSMYPGDDIEFVIDHKRNNVVRTKELVGEEIPACWAALTNESTGVTVIQTIEPCKFVIKRSDLSAFEAIMAGVEIAPAEFNHDALNAVHWNESTLGLKRDIEFFASGKKFFDSRGLAYSRSYLLHGPPGNGKTTTIKAIAKFLNAKPEVFDFSATRNAPDQDFRDWVLGDSERIAREESDYPENESNDHGSDEEVRTPIRLIVIEDIDRLFPRDGAKHTAVTLQAVLQALDGAVERRNTIIVATANEPKTLDQKVLARPGRFDKQIFYSQPSETESFAYLKKLFEDENVSDDVITKACKQLSGHSYAFHKELFATAASYAIERTALVIDDSDVEKGLVDLLTHIDSTAMKSETPKFGFN